MLGSRKRIFQFGVFELDTQSGELRKSGTKLRLGDQPARILGQMLEKPGEVITREELRDLLWGNDTFVDFEHGLSAAINKLREVLGDSASNPRFIETIPKRGYRFLAEVKDLTTPPASAANSGEPSGHHWEDSTSSAATGVESRSPSGGHLLKIRAATAVWIGALLAFPLGLLLWFSGREPTREISGHSTRFEIPVPVQSNFPFFQLSPDGRYVVIAAEQLWIRPLDAWQARPLAGTKGATYPFWSADSKLVGFFADGKLKKISLNGELPQTLCDAPLGRGGTWNREGTIVFSPGPAATPLFRVPAAGGVPVPITNIAAEFAEWHRLPEFLPDGQRFLFVANSSKPELRGVFAGSLERTAPVRILEQASRAVYVPGISRSDGYVLFRSADATLVARPFDPDRLQIGSDVFLIADQVGISYSTSGLGAFSVSENGVLAYQSGANSAGNKQFVWLDRAGKRVGVVPKPNPSDWPRVSPDEKQVVFTIDDFSGSGDLWLQSLDQGSVSRFTFGPGVRRSPIWSPDGRYIAFYRFADGQYEIDRKPANGAGAEERLAGLRTLARPSDWSPDGKLIAFSQDSEKTRADIWILPLNGDRKPYLYLQSSADEHSAQFSPDGRWMAYVSDESGQRQVYVQSIPPSGATWQISTTGGSQPQWRRDGRELFYVAADEKLMAVPVQIGSGFDASSPKVLAGITVQAYTHPVFLYHARANGQQFLVNEPVPGEYPRIGVVLNWQAVIKK